MQLLIINEFIWKTKKRNNKKIQLYCFKFTPNVSDYTLKLQNPSSIYFMFLYSLFQKSTYHTQVKNDG